MVMVVVVGGGIVMRLPGRVLMGMFVFDVIVAMSVRVAQSGHALRVSAAVRLPPDPGAIGWLRDGCSCADGG